MVSILGMLGGALVRYLPGLASFVADWLKGLRDQRQEEASIRLQLELEKARAEYALDKTRLDGELAQALAETQGALEELRQRVGDRRSARDYGARLHTALVNVLQAGSGLGLPRWVLGAGWCVVLTVEAAAASVQPGIAACAFALWASWKGALYWTAWKATGDAGAVLVKAWTLEDWLLIDSVIGFFLAGRATKYADARAAAGFR